MAADRGNMVQLLVGDSQYSAGGVYKKFYSRFLGHARGRLHFAGHSHHFWPDVTRDAILDYWDDSSRYVDAKWSYLWTKIVPRAQGHIARILNSGEPRNIVFAPNTHEFVNRIISCFEEPRAIRILASDSEFHSFRRQAARLAEAGRAKIVQIPSQPISSFVSRMVAEASNRDYDLVWVSHVFFNSGLVVEPLEQLVRGLASSTSTLPLLVIDGYHGFCALPTDLSGIANRIFYIAGGYKYAQSGEGVCFMHVPRGCRLRPMNTGWFADFSGLEARDPGVVHYSDDGMRFAGATFDVSGIYRFNAVMDLFQREGIEVEDIHAHVSRLQRRFLEHVDAISHPWLNRAHLLFHPGASHGHFVTFELPSREHTARLAEQLLAENVVVDYRGNRLRFGFAMYLDVEDVDELFNRLASPARGAG